MRYPAATASFGPFTNRKWCDCFSSFSSSSAGSAELGAYLQLFAGVEVPKAKKSHTKRKPPPPPSALLPPSHQPGGLSHLTQNVFLWIPWARKSKGRGRHPKPSHPSSSSSPLLPSARMSTRERPSSASCASFFSRRQTKKERKVEEEEVLVMGPHDHVFQAGEGTTVELIPLPIPGHLHTATVLQNEPSQEENEQGRRKKKEERERLSPDVLLSSSSSSSSSCCCGASFIPPTCTPHSSWTVEEYDESLRHYAMFSSSASSASLDSPIPQAEEKKEEVEAEDVFLSKEGATTAAGSCAVPSSSPFTVFSSARYVRLYYHYYANKPKRYRLRRRRHGEEGKEEEPTTKERRRGEEDPPEGSRYRLYLAATTFSLSSSSSSSSWKRFLKRFFPFSSFSLSRFSNNTLTCGSTTGATTTQSCMQHRIFSFPRSSVATSFMSSSSSSPPLPPPAFGCCVCVSFFNAFPVLVSFCCSGTDLNVIDDHDEGRGARYLAEQKAPHPQKEQQAMGKNEKRNDILPEEVPRKKTEEEKSNNDDENSQAMREKEAEAVKEGAEEVEEERSNHQNGDGIFSPKEPLFE